MVPAWFIVLCAWVAGVGGVLLLPPLVVVGVEWVWEWRHRP